MYNNCDFFSPYLDHFADAEPELECGVAFRLIEDLVVRGEPALVPNNHLLPILGHLAVRLAHLQVLHLETIVKLLHIELALLRGGGLGLGRGLGGLGRGFFLGGGVGLALGGGGRFGGLGLGGGRLLRGRLLGLTCRVGYT